ncbi:MAG: LamG-like jellyroll fold domain-containing protein [Limisphaerales bacterium]
MNRPTPPRRLPVKRMAASALAALLLPGTLPALAQNLTVTQGLTLWLKADAGVTADGGGVTQWADQSGNNNNAFQGDPTFAPALVADAINGKEVLRFDGTDDYLEVADSESLSGAGDLTSFFVVRFDDFATFRAVWAKTSVNLPGPTDYYAQPGSGVPRLYRGNGSGTGLASFDGTALRAGAFLVAGFGIEGDQASHFLSSQVTTTGTLTADVADADTSLFIGTRGDFFTKLKGDLAEVLIYDRALSPAERSTVADYLATKYDIQNLPPSVSLARTPPEATVETGTTLTLTATASDPDGRVERVEFIANGTVVATATAPPFRARVTVKTSGEFRLAARAIDDKDARATSTELTVTASAPPTAPVLDVKDNLQLWLSADSGVIANGEGKVNSWFDQSGKSNDASQADAGFAPAYVDNGIGDLPVIRFDGVDDYLDVADSESLSIAGDITSLFVVKMENFATFRAVWGKTQANQPAPTDYYTLPGSGIPRLYRGNAQGSLGFADGGSALTAGAFQVAGFSVASGAVAHVLNGKVTSTGVISATPADLDTSLKIGTRDDFVTRLQGDLAELLIYDAGLSEANLEKAQIYLGQKYGIGLISPTNSLPAVAITAPVPGASSPSPATVEIQATATDPDGSIVRVDFLLNGALAASDSTAPYTASLTFPTSDESVLTAVAHDNLGGRAASAEVPLSITSDTPIALPAAARLKLWLKADAGVTTADGGVSLWEDQSGNLNHATQSGADLRPQLVPDSIGGRPSLFFDGDNDSLEIPHSLSLAMVRDLTTYFVVRVDDFDTFRAVWAKTDGNQPRATDFYVVPTTGIPRALRGGSGGGSVDGLEPLVPGEFAIVGFDMRGTALRHSLNGAPNGQGIIGGTFADTGRPLRIGTRDDGVTRLRGDVAELIIYNASLSDADQASVVRYLGTKYGIPVAAGPPQLTVSRAANGTQITIQWPADASDYVLESTDRLPGGTWLPVPGVSGTTATIPVGPGNAYYRLAKP